MHAQIVSKSGQVSTEADSRHSSKVADKDPIFNAE